MKQSTTFFIVFTILLAGVSSVWSEPSFWKKDGTPTPSSLKPPQVAPVEEDENNPANLNAQVTPTPVEAPVLGEPVAAPTPVLGKKTKHPTLAGLMSAVIPGSGNVYAAQPLRGVLFAGVFGVALWQSIENFKKTDGVIKNSNAGQLFGLAALVAYGFGVQDAYDSANRYNHRYHLKVAYDLDTRGPRLMIARSF
jgi:hypothetical protein